LWTLALTTSRIHIAFREIIKRLGRRLSPNADALKDVIKINFTDTNESGACPDL
jgi:hypothetical protein